MHQGLEAERGQIQVIDKEDRINSEVNYSSGKFLQKDHGFLITDDFRSRLDSSLMWGETLCLTYELGWAQDFQVRHCGQERFVNHGDLHDQGCVGVSPVLPSWTRWQNQSQYMNHIETYVPNGPLFTTRPTLWEALSPVPNLVHSTKNFPSWCPPCLDCPQRGTDPVGILSSWVHSPKWWTVQQEEHMHNLKFITRHFVFRMFNLWGSFLKVSSMMRCYTLTLRISKQ